MNENAIAITAASSLSASGCATQLLHKMLSGKSCITRQNDTFTYVGSVSEQLPSLELDRTALLATAVSRKLKEDLQPEAPLSVCIGSARGCTSQLESSHRAFLESGKLPVKTSPLTTSGSISNAVLQEFLSSGMSVDLSSTCVSGFHAIGTAAAWLRSGMAKRVVAGGAEAPLTDFVISQIKALGIYSEDETDFPCKPLAGDKVNRFVLGEAAALLCLERLDDADPESILAIIEEIGFASEITESPTGISENGEAIYNAMRKVTGKTSDSIDAVILHAPGTVSGDAAEMMAVRDFFGEKIPALVSSKWVIGHTLGASGAVNLCLALAMLMNQKIPRWPYEVPLPVGQEFEKPVNRILVNCAGFGGIAGSVLVSRHTAARYQSIASGCQLLS